jgi:hypothetical protein
MTRDAGAEMPDSDAGVFKESNAAFELGATAKWVK